jgi:bifunctional NMN adenylyltransferase/nudix hydrolase
MANTEIVEYEAAVFVGHFQPFHNGHLALLRHALSVAPLCVVVIGSAHQTRSPKNPFTWEERREMVRLALPAADRERVLFIALRDYYDAARWAAAVRRSVGQLLAQRGLAPSANVALVGHFKDATSVYLRDFPEWKLVSAPAVPSADATSIRDAYFHVAGSHVDAALASLVSQAPTSTLEFLRAWSVQPHFASVSEEWCVLRRYKEQWAAAPHPVVFVTVDAVVRCAGHVLLVRRGQAPGKGLYAVPGGFIEERETAYQSALRELHEETSLSLLELTMQQSLKATAVFDHPDRSQRGRTITHAHYFDLGDRELPEVKAGDDAAAVEWMPIERLISIEDRFLDDHFHMLDHFLGLTVD